MPNVLVLNTYHGNELQPNSYSRTNQNRGFVMHSTVFILTVLLIVTTGSLGALIVLFFTMKRQIVRDVSFLPAYNNSKNPSSDYLRKRCKELEKKELERKIYLELIRIIPAAESFDSLAVSVINALCVGLNCKFAAFLWENKKTERLEFRYFRGYDLPKDFSLPVFSSIAGRSLYQKTPIAIDTKNAETYQTIPGTVETSVICVPLKLFGEYTCILRFANPGFLLELTEITDLFIRMAPLLSSAFEHILISRENARRKGQLTAISAISSSLNRTVSTKEIFLISAKALRNIFMYSYCNIFTFSEDGAVESACVVPREILFDCGLARSRIILRNICEKKEPLLIENISKCEFISGANKEICSIISTPINIDDSPYGTIIVASPADSPFTTEDLSALRLVSEQISMTISRALHFRKREELAIRDGLTGLYNRTYFQEMLYGEWQRWARYQRAFSLLMLDVDHFKRFNDTHGHQAGDLALKAVASALKNSLRLVDCACRYGGEEFVIILRETSSEGAMLLAKRLQETIAQRPIQLPQKAVQLTVSIGVADASAKFKTPEEVLEAADKALYASKHAGRNQVSLYQPKDIPSPAE